MVGVGFEDPLALCVLYELVRHVGLGFRIRVPSLLVIALEEFPEGGPPAVDHHLAGSEVDRSGHRAVDAAQVNGQLVVHVEPEVVVSRELEYDVVAPFVESVRGHGESGPQLHGEEAVRRLAAVFDIVEALVLSRVVIAQLRTSGIIEVESVDYGEIARLQIVVGEELAVLEGRPRAGRIVGSQFLVYGEIAARRPLQGGKVLRAVIFKVSRPAVRTLYEQVVDVLGAAEELPQRAALRGRITVHQICGQKSLLQGCSRAAGIAPQEITHLFPGVEVLHLHLDAVQVVIHCRHGRQRVVRIEILHDGKIEVHSLRDPARLDRTSVDLQSRIGVVVLIPCQNLTVILSISPARQVDTDGVVGEDLPAVSASGAAAAGAVAAADLRGDILF